MTLNHAECQEGDFCDCAILGNRVFCHSLNIRTAGRSECGLGRDNSLRFETAGWSSLSILSGAICPPRGQGAEACFRHLLWAM